jgi:hypothetical protein
VRRERAEPILPAQDVGRARAFYESLGFRAGYRDDRYDILRRGELVVHRDHHRSANHRTNRGVCANSR